MFLGSESNHLFRRALSGTLHGESLEGDSVATFTFLEFVTLLTYDEPERFRSSKV
jgi:hypothetical protein